MCTYQSIHLSIPYYIIFPIPTISLEEAVVIRTIFVSILFSIDNTFSESTQKVSGIHILNQHLNIPEISKHASAFVPNYIIFPQSTGLKSGVLMSLVGR